MWARRCRAGGSSRRVGAAGARCERGARGQGNHHLEFGGKPLETVQTVAELLAGIAAAAGSGVSAAEAAREAARAPAAAAAAKAAAAVAKTPCSSALEARAQPGGRILVLVQSRALGRRPPRAAWPCCKAIQPWLPWFLRVFSSPRVAGAAGFARGHPRKRLHRRPARGMYGGRRGGAHTHKGPASPAGLSGVTPFPVHTSRRAWDCERGE
jgi:hypothetical protein